MLFIVELNFILIHPHDCILANCCKCISNNTCTHALIHSIQFYRLKLILNTRSSIHIKNIKDISQITLIKCKSIAAD